MDGRLRRVPVAVQHGQQMVPRLLQIHCGGGGGVEVEAGVGHPACGEGDGVTAELSKWPQSAFVPIDLIC